MSDQGFALPGSSYKELIKIIQGYRQVGNEAAPSDVAKVIGMHETIVSGNNRFLVALGIVKGGRKKTMTSVGNELALALDHGVEEHIGSNWRAIVDSTDFLQKVIAAVRIRKGMDESSLETHIAYSAGQPKTPRVTTGAGTIVQILKVAGALREEGGNLVATVPELTMSPESPLEVGSVPQGPSPSPGPPGRAEIGSVGGAHLNIDVRIQCTPQDLDGLGQKLRKLLEELNQEELKTESTAPATQVDKESN